MSALSICSMFARVFAQDRDANIMERRKNVHLHMDNGEPWIIPRDTRDAGSARYGTTLADWPPPDASPVIKDIWAMFPQARGNKAAQVRTHVNTREHT
jgi:hypothetical protein